MSVSGLRNVLESIGTDLSMLGDLRTGTTLARMKKIDRQMLDAIYYMAFTNYNAGRLREAESLFMFLCMHDHRDPRFLTGLGSCRCEQGNYEFAIELLKLSSQIDKNNPHTLIALASAYRSLGELENAKAALADAMKVIDENSSLVQERQKAERLSLILQKDESDV